MAAAVEGAALWDVTKGAGAVAGGAGGWAKAAEPSRAQAGSNIKSRLGVSLGFMTQSFALQ